VQFLHEGASAGGLDRDHLSAADAANLFPAGQAPHGIDDAWNEKAEPKKEFDRYASRGVSLWGSNYTTRFADKITFWKSNRALGNGRRSGG